MFTATRKWYAGGFCHFRNGENWKKRSKAVVFGGSFSRHGQDLLYKAGGRKLGIAKAYDYWGKEVPQAGLQERGASLD